jgi:hypothetical protein
LIHQLNRLIPVITLEFCYPATRQFDLLRLITVLLAEIRHLLVVHYHPPFPLHKKIRQLLSGFMADTEIAPHWPPTSTKEHSQFVVI